MRFIRIVSISLLLFTTVCGQANKLPAGINVGAGLTVEYIANEGVLIKSGSATILLDAIHRRYKPAYAFTPDAILQKIEAGRSPYNKIDLILVSHNHLDHFSAESVAKHLRNNSSAVVASSEQVINEIAAASKMLDQAAGRETALTDRLNPIKHEWKKKTMYEIGDVKIQFLGLLHANSKLKAYRDIQNLGHIIQIGGKKLLHIGDADMFAENFSAFEIEKQEIDVAFIPYWFMLSAEGRDIIRNKINADVVVAVHVPPEDQSATIRQILGAMPSAVVFSQPGEMLNY